MTKKWIKILKKENNKEEILAIVNQLLTWDFDWLDVIKMQWTNNYYRCRIGKIRIIFFSENGKYYVDKIWYRGDVYKWL